jgi:hypothetical protein
MTIRSIEELACEAADEVSRKLDGFGIPDVEDVGDALQITLCWALPSYFEITITVHESDTDDSVKNEIRRQLLEKEIRRQRRPTGNSEH